MKNIVKQNKCNKRTGNRSEISVHLPITTFFYTTHNGKTTKFSANHSANFLRYNYLFRYKLPIINVNVFQLNALRMQLFA